MSTAPGTVVQRAVARRRRRDPVCARGSVWQQTFLGSVQFRTMKRRTTSILTLQEAKLNRWSSLALHLSLLAWGTCSAAAQGRASQGLLPSGGACSAAAEGTHAQLACAPSRRIRERRLCREQGEKEEYSRRQEDKVLGGQNRDNRKFTSQFKESCELFECVVHSTMYAIK